MTIDTILNPKTPTKRQVQAAFQVTLTVAETIRTVGEIPSGHLYAQVCGHMDLPTYERIIATLKHAGLVSESAHLLTWVGPKLDGK